MIKTRVTDPKLQLALRDAARSEQPFQIQTLGPTRPERGTFLVYGPPGAGKTHFAGTFPKPIFIDIGGGVETVRSKRVAFFQPTTYLDLLLTTNEESIQPYETYVLDTATEAVRLVTEHALNMTQRDIPTLAEWMMTIEYFRRLLRGILELPVKYVVVTAQEATIKDEDTGRILMGPSLPGKLFHEVGALFDCVFPMKMGKVGQEKSRVLLTEPEGLYTQARSRFHGLSRYEEPDFPKLWEKICRHATKEVQNA